MAKTIGTKEAAAMGRGHSPGSAGPTGTPKGQKKATGWVAGSSEGRHSGSYNLRGSKTHTK